MKAHSNFYKIRSVVQRLLKKAAPFSGFGYRCTEPKYASEIISGLGSQLHGGRWNPKGSFPTVYLCDSADAALAEYLARARRMNIPDYKSLPMVMVGVKVRVARLLDLTDPEIMAQCNTFLRTEKTHWRSIQAKREAVSQALGRAAQEICFTGLITPSQAFPTGKNIVIFRRKLAKTDILKALMVKPDL
jgi:RES domain-containing protein